MREFVAGMVTLGLAVVGASVAYQVVKPGSQGPQVVTSLVGAETTTVGDLFKG